MLPAPSAPSIRLKPFDHSSKVVRDRKVEDLTVEGREIVSDHSGEFRADMVGGGRDCGHAVILRQNWLSLPLIR
ncbi:hypothetical protein MAE02_68290 [Microvirga aerophila]|uniref:Uncharacterized protein n=1 Tax=Microvirga aerophila TaxID=670291 RepID=A0A512C4H7_9HYPH|nr:hypothetical protein MAE02_68290 [Microvirga aerophila]